MFDGRKVEFFSDFGVFDFVSFVQVYIMDKFCKVIVGSDSRVIVEGFEFDIRDFVGFRVDMDLQFYYIIVSWCINKFCVDIYIFFVY